MTTMSVRLPTSLHRQLRELATREGVSMNQFVSSAVGEKLAALLAADYLEQRARRGSRAAYDGVLAKVRGVAPAEHDALPDGRMRRRTTASKRASPR